MTWIFNKRAERGPIVIVPLWVYSGPGSHVGVCENATIRWQGLSSLLHWLRQWLFRVVNQWLPDVLIVDLIFLGNGQSFDHRCAWYCSQIAELIVMIVLGWAQVRLARGQPRRDLAVEESICNAKTLTRASHLINVPLLWLERAEQAVTLVICLMNQAMVSKCEEL